MSHYPYFRDKETEAQRGAVSVLGVTQLVGDRDGI